MTFDPDKLGPASKAAWDKVLAAVSAMGTEWAPWSDVVDGVSQSVPEVAVSTVNRLVHHAVSTGMAERRGKHPHREIRAGTGEPPVPLSNRLADRLEGLERVGPGETTGRNLARGEAMLDWLVEDVLPNVDLTTRSGRPGPWLAQITKAIDSQGRAAVAAAQLGVEERRLAIEEAQLADIEAAVTAALAELGIDQAVARPVIARHLLAIEAASTPLAPGEQSANPPALSADDSGTSAAC